jgi:hypothetical protein
MKITLLPDQQKFTFEFEGVEQEVLFSEVLASSTWLERKSITIVHTATDENGNHSVTTLNRNVYLDNMKHSDEEYLKAYNLWDLNTSIHKLYALLDGKTEKEVDDEIANVSTQRTALDLEKRAWSNDQVLKYAALEETLADVKTDEEAIAIKEQLQSIKKEPPPFLVSKEMKKLYYAANDASKKAIKLSNVTPDKVKAAYGSSLIIQ